MKIHKGKQILRDLCADTMIEEKKFSEHKVKKHGSMRSPDAKRMKEEIHEKTEECEDRMEVDDDLVVLSNLKDEKVLKMQKRFEEEEARAKEMKILKEKEQLEEMRKIKKEKAKRDSVKKKNKKKEQNENVLLENLEDGGELNNRKEIDRKYTEVMREAGLDINEYCIWSAAPDGACGSTCTAIHCHKDKKLGRYVRRNINEYLSEFWPFFKSYFQFPLEVKVGLNNKKFENEVTFLEFLKNDSQSGLMWMDHFGLQIVSNMYQISVHILTTGVIGLKEPRARWTHLEPDTRLSSFSTVHKGLPDMWLLHVDETHFDLLIRKDSDSPDVGSIVEMENTEDVTEKENIDEITQEEAYGPGYMGWKIDDKGVQSGDMDYKKELADLKNTMNMMQIEFAEMKKDFQKVDKKEISKLKNEIKEIKESFTQCIDDLKTETIKRNEAETLVKVLKDTIEAKKVLEEKRGCDNILEEKQEEKKHVATIEVKEAVEMEIDDINEYESSNWELQRKQKQNNKKRTRSVMESKSFDCEICTKKFKTKVDIEKHKTEHMSSECNTSERSFNTEDLVVGHRESKRDSLLKCDICEERFSKKEELWSHGQEHEGHELSCDNCSAKFLTKSDLNTHVLNHKFGESFVCQNCGKHFKSKSQLEMHMNEHVEETSIQEFSCTKCDKKYGDMRKLRRHDWRCHRSIECTICGEELESRQQITNHRQTKHKIFKITSCKFFPACYDGEECFFEHDGKNTGCPNGISCQDQSCEYSEKDHKIIENKTNCKFQEKCDRSGCRYLHIKKNFLGGSASRLGKN